MQKEYTEQWNKWYECVSKPLMSTIDLNVETLSNLAKNSNVLEELASVRKPEDMLAAQLRLTNKACLESMKYTQKAMQIGMDAMTEWSKCGADVCSKATGTTASKK